MKRVPLNGLIRQRLAREPELSPLVAHQVY